MSPIVVWGAGAIGGTIGAYLAREGLDVVFVDTDVDHVAEMNRSGLRIEGHRDLHSTRAGVHAVGSRRHV